MTFNDFETPTQVEDGKTLVLRDDLQFSSLVESINSDGEIDSTHRGNVCQTWKFGEKVFDTSEPVAKQPIEQPVEQEVKRFNVARKEKEQMLGDSAFEPLQK